MTNFNIKASYNKNDHSSQLSPTITNNVTVGLPIATESRVTNTIAESSSSSSSSSSVEPKLKSLIPTDMVKSSGKCCDVDPNCLQRFKNRLLEIALAVLTTRDKTLLANVTAKPGEIILSEPDMIELIQLITGETNVSIVHGEDAVMCMGCIPKPKLLQSFSVPIESIMVNGTEFRIDYNRIHNTFLAHRLSLDSVAV